MCVAVKCGFRLRNAATITRKQRHAKRDDSEKEREILSYSHNNKKTRAKCTAKICLRRSTKGGRYVCVLLVEVWFGAKGGTEM